MSYYTPGRDGVVLHTETMAGHDRMNGTAGEKTFFDTDEETAFNVDRSHLADTQWANSKLAIQIISNVKVTTILLNC